MQALSWSMTESPRRFKVKAMRERVDGERRDGSLAGTGCLSKAISLAGENGDGGDENV